MSLTVYEGQWLLSGEDVKELYSAVKVPQLFMPASGDAEEDMSNGLGKEVIIFSTEQDKRQGQRIIS